MLSIVGTSFTVTVLPVVVVVVIVVPCLAPDGCGGGEEESHGKKPNQTVTHLKQI